jgi:hypothetical protein
MAELITARLDARRAAARFDRVMAARANHLEVQRFERQRHRLRNRSAMVRVQLALTWQEGYD